MADGQARRRRRPHDRFHTLAASGGAARGVHATRRGRRGPALPGRLLSGRLPRRGPPRDRAAPRRGRPPRGGRDQRARARDRHRVARRGRPHGVPGDPGVDVAAGGPGGAPGRGVARDAGGAGRSPGPVPRPPSGGPLRQAGRGRGDRPREPLRPGAAPALRCPRAADRGRGPRLLRVRTREPRSSGWASEGSSRGAATPGTTPDASPRTEGWTCAREPAPSTRS